MGVFSILSEKKITAKTHGLDFLHSDKQKKETQDNTYLDESLSSKINQSPEPEETKQIVAEITIGRFYFNPPFIIIKKGTTITWVNNDENNHQILNSEEFFDSGIIKPKQKFSYKFNKSGVFNYSCQITPKLKGRIVVTE